MKITEKTKGDDDLQTEHDFLKEYDMSAYERPSVTADIVLFTIRSTEEDSYRHDPQGRLSILLIKRGGHPYKDFWALPGGFLQSDETVEQCALRELREETNVTPTSLMPVGVYSEIDRDPRGWIISNAFASVMGEDLIKQEAGDDALDAQWFDMQFRQDAEGLYHLELTHESISLHAVLKQQSRSFGKTKFEIIDRGGIAFDHVKIIAEALSTLRNEAENFDAIFDFLPEKFTLAALQRVQETIMNISVVSANFRRKAADFVEETDEYQTGAGHRPARLFRKKTDKKGC